MRIFFILVIWHFRFMPNIVIFLPYSSETTENFTLIKSKNSYSIWDTGQKTDFLKYEIYFKGRPFSFLIGSKNDSQIALLAEENDRIHVESLGDTTDDVSFAWV